MMGYRYAVTHDKWLDAEPPTPKPPGGDPTWKLVSVVTSGGTGSSVAFYWQRELVEDTRGPFPKGARDG